MKEFLAKHREDGVQDTDQQSMMIMKLIMMQDSSHFPSNTLKDKSEIA